MQTAEIKFLKWQNVICLPWVKKWCYLFVVYINGFVCTLAMFSSSIDKVSFYVLWDIYYCLVLSITEWFIVCIYICILCVKLQNDKCEMQLAFIQDTMNPEKLKQMQSQVRIGGKVNGCFFSCCVLCLHSFRFADCQLYHYCSTSLVFHLITVWSIFDIMGCLGKVMIKFLSIMPYYAVNLNRIVCVFEKIFSLFWYLFSIR